MAVLRVGLGLIAPGLTRIVFFAVAAADDLSGGSKRFFRDAKRVRSHVGDEAGLASHLGRRDVYKRQLSEALTEILGTLTEREADVLKMRFGMYDGRTHTLEEVGQIFGVTRERIRQIENKAIRKLRHPSRAKKIKDFYC